MGQSAENPTVKFYMTKADARRLAETLVKYREQLDGVIDPVGKGQRDFLTTMIENLQSSIRIAG